MQDAMYAQDKNKSKTMFIEVHHSQLFMRQWLCVQCSNEARCSKTKSHHRADILLLHMSLHWSIYLIQVAGPVRNFTNIVSIIDLKGSGLKLGNYRLPLTAVVVFNFH